MRTLQSRGNEALPAELSPWFHNLHLPDGVQTAPDHPLGDFPSWKWQQIAPHLPDDLSGVRALDIGCNAGFYSFELARRGADVVAIDIDEHYLRQARWAAARLDLLETIEFRQAGVYELARMRERFDLVLLLGVLYHLRHPLLALDIVAERLAGTLVLQTLTLPGDARLQTPHDLPLDRRERMRDPGWPAMAFIEHELAGDATNWWAADRACVEAMVRSCGLRVVARPGDEIWICHPDSSRDERTAGRVRAELLAATGRTD
jgi:tRNA (mo5U34)-methyltransferase